MIGYRGWVAAALFLSACGSTLSGGSEEPTPAESPTATAAGGTAAPTSQAEQATPSRTRESFFDRLKASGGPSHLDVSRVPQGARCQGRAYTSNPRADVTGRDLMADGRRVGQPDGTYTWNWDGELFHLPTNTAAASPGAEINIQLVATCTLSGQSGSVSLDLSVPL